ncbi:MAG: LuxR C-terminal-related transcriptional regulator [Caldilineaceae bacterium]
MQHNFTRTISNNLPLRLSNFIGREHDLAEVHRLLATQRLVTLTGVGGCGKTRLAIQVAEIASATSGDGVWLVDLTPLRDPNLIPQLVAQTLSLRQPSNQPVFEALLTFVHAKQLLLILDNCEHMIAACAHFVQQMLAQAPALRILATSREPLAIGGEAVYPLEGLAWPSLNLEAAGNRPHDFDPQGLMQFDAVRLFTARAQAISPKFTITAENAPAIMDICQRLDGIPLALELASARVNVLTVQQIAARLDDRLALLTASQRSTSAPHHHSLRAAIDWSYDLLSPPERTLLQRLSLFNAGFTLSTGEAVCGWGAIQRDQVLGLLASLVSKSMVAAETLQGSEARYRLLETMRQYAQEKLSASTEWMAAYNHYLASYVRLTEEVAPKLREQYQQLWFNWLETENDNIRTALSWAVEHGRIEEGLRIGAALFVFWQMRGYAREGRSWFERLLRRADDHVSLAARVNGLTWLSVLAAMAGDLAASTARGAEAMALCKGAGEEGKHLLQVALIGAATAARSAGDYATTYTLGRPIIELFRELGDNTSVATGRLVMGQIATALGKYDEAHALLDASLAFGREATDTILIAMALHALGDLARCEEYFANACAYYAESLPFFGAVGATHELAVAQHGLAYALLRQGNTTRAQALFRESLTVMRTQEDREGVLKGVMGFAALAAAAGLASDSACLYAAARAHEVSKSVTCWPPEKLAYAYYLGQVQAQLSDADFAAAQEKGRALSIEEAIDYALRLPLAAPAPKSAPPLLTAREREIASLIAQGKTNGAIADELVLSKRTVEKHVANILAKLDLTSRAQIIRWALDHTPAAPSPQ